MTAPDIEGARRSARLVLEVAVPAFSPDVGRAAFHEQALATLLLSAVEPDKAGPLIEMARAGDRDARVAVEAAIAGFSVVGEPIPPLLRDYLLEFVLMEAGPGRRGMSAHKHHARDEWITMAVQAAMAYDGIRKTRNREKRDTESACSIVTAILAENGIHMTEANVEAIAKDIHERPKT